MKLGVGFATLLAAASASVTYGISISGVPRALCHGTQRLTAISEQADPSWAPDGTEYAFGNVDGIFVANAHGDVLHPLDTPDSGELRYDPAWSPTGNWIAFVTGYYGQRIELVSPDGQRSMGVPGTSGGIESETSSPTWAPDGAHLDYVFEVSDPSRGPNGIYSIGIDGSDRHLVVQDGEDPALSPDGSRLAYVKVTWQAPYGNRRDLFVANADGSEERRLTWTPTLDENNPAWSPDGRTIAFDTDRSEPGNLDVWVMNADGSDQHAVIASIALDALPAYSRDGTKLAFVSERTSKNDRRIYVSDTNGKNVQRLAVPAGGRWQMNPVWGVRPSGDHCTIEGTINADVLTGTSGSDTICGGAGADVITGGGGSDTLLGGPGDDRIMAKDRHRDVVDGGPGRDAAAVDRKLDRVRGVEIKTY